METKSNCEPVKSEKSKNSFGPVLIIILVLIILGVISYAFKDKIFGSKKQVLKFKQESIEITSNIVNLYDYLDIKNIDKNKITITSSNKEAIEIRNNNIVINDYYMDAITIMASFNDLKTETVIKINKVCKYFLNTIPTNEEDGQFRINPKCETFNVKMGNEIELTLSNRKINSGATNASTWDNNFLKLNGSNIKLEMIDSMYTYRIFKFNNMYAFEKIHMGSAAQHESTILYDMSGNIIKSFDEEITEKPCLRFNFDNENNIVEVDASGGCGAGGLPVFGNPDLGFTDCNMISNVITKYKYDGISLNMIDTQNVTYKDKGLCNN